MVAARIGLVGLVMCSLVGCFGHIKNRCPECAVVSADVPSRPPITEDARALVVLVHGAFGFGPEWDPVLSALRARTDVSYFAFAWHGPIGGAPPDPADAFLEAMQLTLDQLPSSVREVLVLAHSAGGGLADYAARRLRIPAGVRLRVALLDPKEMFAPYQPMESIATPFGPGAGARVVVRQPLPSSVDECAYRAADPPRRSLPARWRYGQEATYYLGHRVTHGEAVGLVAVPLITELGR